jgi:predicted component of type VI protein secretion system
MGAHEGNEVSAAWDAGLWVPVSDNRLEQAYNRYRNKEMAMEDVNPVQISNQLGQIVAQLSAIREALEKLVAQSDNAAYSQTKRY